MTNIRTAPAAPSRTAAATAARMHISDEKAATKLRDRGWILARTQDELAIELRARGWTCTPPAGKA